ncbi:sigma-54-dependent Fis family transcriptional regulator [Clostridium sp. HMP27]|uniref:sigma-54-dependent Fis family transcriptional regulator n=1 Tax=Clostridium sp. HMP27 TaxID=1487921 RepID=UPI00052C9BAE|nr:sigma-54-dependent Fis family transcriptional regulator [Clostridium sp. HMP27]KGK86456.1 hypothetical protein DP68_13755 [Clostridium sp. HMP27]
MNKTKILAIAPYEGMKEAMLSIANHREDISLTVKVGNLKNGLQIVQETLDENYDIIISRGGTAEMIEKAIDMPIVEISISVYDVLRAIKLAENYTDKFAIVGYPSITNCAYLLCDLLQYKIDIYTITSDLDVNTQLASLKDKGYGMVLCDVISFTVARQNGMNAILITSGTESIEAAFNQAIELSNRFHYIQKQRDLYQMVLKESDNKVVMYDATGKLCFSTLSESEENNKILTWIKEGLSNFIEDTNYRIEKKCKNFILTIYNKHVMCDDQLYIIIYISFKNNHLILNDDSISLYNKKEEDGYDLTNYFSSLNYNSDIQNTIEEYSHTTLPILIMGEIGTGKSKAATIIYENGPYKNNPSYIIDCELTNDRHWSTLLSSDNSPLNGVHTTIYFKNIDKLSSLQISKLVYLLENTNFHKRNRIIFSFVCNNNSLIQENPIYKYLTNHLSCLTLQLPPLRERTDDIASISTLYINAFNTSLGKQIIGFEPEAITLLQGFYWENNLDQLKRVIQELVVITSTSYISKENTYRILKKESPSQVLSKIPGSALINLNQPLSDISYDIIRLVLAEENMNQGKAAERLGISRSTLWRMTKSHV